MAQAAPDPALSKSDVATAAEPVNPLDTETAPDDDGILTRIENQVEVSDYEEPAGAEPVLLLAVASEDQGEAPEPEGPSAVAGKRLEDSVAALPEEEIVVEAEEDFIVTEEAVPPPALEVPASPALASAARAAVARRSRVVEKPALTAEIDDQISAIDRRLNDLEQLIDSIERCLAGFEPLRESAQEKSESLSAAA